MNCRRLLTLVVMLVLGVSGMLAQTTTRVPLMGSLRTRLARPLLVLELY